MQQELPQQICIVRFYWSSPFSNAIDPVIRILLCVFTGMLVAFTIVSFAEQSALFSGHPFDMPFPAHRVMFGILLLVIYQLHRQAGAGILCSFSAVMSSDALCKICCPSTVECVVPTTENINVVHNRYVLIPPVIPGRTSPQHQSPLSSDAPSRCLPPA